MVIRDVENAYNVYLIGVATCLILIFLYNWMLRCFAEILTWMAIVAVGVGIGLLGFFIYDYQDTNYPEGDTTKKWLEISAYTCWVLTGIYVLTVCCLYYSIKISVRVLKTSAKVIMRNMRMVLVPVIGFILISAYLAFSIYFLLYLMSCGEMQVVESFGVQYTTYTWTKD